MATKIGFKAKPLIDSGGVDWLSVTKDVVKTLTEQEEAREATRVKGQADYAADVKQMVETPLGKDAEANEWLTNGITSITGSAGMDNRLWRSGALSTKDYMRNRANRTQGTDLVLSAYKTYNKNYDAVMKGIDDKSLAGEKMLFLKAQAESMFDFGKTGLYINPLNSEINVAKKQLVDGAYVMSDNPNEFLNASELMQAASAMYKGFDANTAAATLAESVGQRLIRDGFGNTIESAYMAVTGADNDTKSKIKQARLDQVRGILNNEDAGAYLTDTLNEGFSFTKDADEAATKNKVMSKMILLNQDGSTTLSKEQMDYAVDKFDTLLEVYLPKEKKAPLAPKPSAYQQRSQKQTQIDTQNATSWGQLYYGIPEQQEQAADRLLASPIARKEDLIDIDVRTEPGKVVLRYKDSTKDRKIDILDDAGNPMPYADFVSLGNELHGIDDYGRALELSGREDATYNIDRKGRATRAGKANLYNDPETLVTYDGKRNTTPKSIIENIPNEVDKDVIETVSDVFSLLNLPKPVITIKEGGEELKASETRTTPRGTPLVVKQAVIASPSMEITFPGVSPINIPEGEDFQDTLSKIMEVLDSSFKSNVDISIEEIKAAFPTLEMFELYNPGFTTESTTTAETTSETSTKRSVNQIMKEDGVSRTEAVKIFKEQ